MRYLIASAGDRPDDFDHAQRGEPVVFGTLCCNNPECGCDRAFIGVNSRKGTTVAEVAEVDDTVESLAAKDVRGLGVNQNNPNFKLRVADAAEVIRAIADEAAKRPLGARVRRLSVAAAPERTKIRSVEGVVLADDADTVATRGRWN